MKSTPLYMTFIIVVCSLCGTHDADCSVEPVSAGHWDSVYQELASPTTAGSPADVTSRKISETIKYSLYYFPFFTKYKFIKNPRSQLQYMTTLCLHLLCVPAAAVEAGWFRQCVFLWSDWSAPPLSAELTGETEHPSVCPPTGSFYHSRDGKIYY